MSLGSRATVSPSGSRGTLMDSWWAFHLGILAKWDMLNIYLFSKFIFCLNQPSFQLNLDYALWSHLIWLVPAPLHEIGTNDYLVLNCWNARYMSGGIIVVMVMSIIKSSRFMLQWGVLLWIQLLWNETHFAVRTPCGLQSWNPSHTASLIQRSHHFSNPPLNLYSNQMTVG